MKTIPEPGYGLIYLLTFDNGKPYVGLTETPLEDRLSVHKSAAKSKRSKVYNGWRKHGLRSAKVIHTCRAGAELRAAEIRFIAEYDSYRNGYNSTTGGDVSPLHFPEGRAAHKAAMEQWHADPVNKAANIEKMKKLNADPVAMAASIERTKRMNARPDWKAAQSERSKKLNADPAVKAALSEQMKRMQADPAFKAALSERSKKWHADFENQSKLAVGRAIYWAQQQNRPYSNYDAGAAKS
jgi:GIY-YIG catalytic domain